MRRWIVSLGVFLPTLLLAQPAKPAPPPEQPLPFSHKTHISAAKLNCQDCHTGPAKFGDPIGFPASTKCMACHILVAKEKPAIEKLSALARTREPIAWERVYKLPDFVFFDHRYHLLNGATCEDCHGNMAEQEVTSNELSSTKMGYCQQCHTRTGAARSCNTCHNYR